MLSEVKQLGPQNPESIHGGHCCFEGPYDSVSRIFPPSQPTLPWGRNPFQGGKYTYHTCVYLSVYPLHLVSKPLSTMEQTILCEGGLYCVL